MWIWGQWVSATCPIKPALGGPEGAGIWLWLLTSQSGSSEPCLKGLSAISVAEKPGESGEAAGALIYIRAESNDEQPPDSTERLPAVLISASTHFDIQKERRPRPFPRQLCWATAISCFCFSISCWLYLSVFLPLSPFPTVSSRTWDLISP